MTIFGIAPGRLALALAALFGALAFALAAFACDFIQRAAGRGAPNILVILVDDLGYNDVGYNGAARISTPNIDRLAREGVIFSNGYVPYPSCGPSRAAIMTGRHPARFGMELNLAYAPFDEEHGLPVEESTIADYLDDAGYRTGVVGKWQLGAAPPFHPLNRGFDEFFGFLGGGHNYFEIDLTRSPLSEYLLPLNEGRGATGFDGYLTDVLTDEAIEFVASEADGEPFFLYLAYNAPHSPLQAPDSLIREYADVENEDRRRYLAMIHSLDDNVGRLMSALEEAGRREDTLIFFLSDNGGVTVSDIAPDQNWSDNAPFSGGKGFFAEGGVRVPFIASWTGAWPVGETYSPMVVSMDVMATALGVAGVAPGAERPLDGVNLDPFLRGEADGAPRDALFWRQWQFRESDNFAARVGDLKLIKDIGQDTTARLYDLAADPAETRDLIAERPEDALRIAERWNAWNAGNVNGAYPWLSRYYETRDAAAAELAADFRARGESEPPYRIPAGMLSAPSRGDATCWNGVAVADPFANPALAEDCEALLASKTALGGGALNWSYAVPIDEWDGLTVGGSPPRARKLALTERGLDGAIPPELGALDGLRELALSRNSLSGAIPPELGGLTNLRILALATNRLSGAIPPELGGIAALSELWLRGNLLTGEIPAELGELQNLTVIRLADNQLAGCVPAALGDVESEDYSLAGLVVCGR